MRVGLVDVKKTDALLAVAREVVPRHVETDGNYEDWNVIAPALVAIAADLFEGIMASVPPRGRTRAEVLARSLAEYAITFAWLAGPDSEREKRLKQLLKKEYRNRERIENQLSEPQYKSLIDAGTLSISVLPEKTRDFMAPLLGDETVPKLPNALELAFEADREWRPRVETIQRYPFVFVYFSTFTGLSSTTHPSITGITNVVTELDGKTVVGAPRELEEASGPYGGGYMALLNTLWVAALSLGWPAPAAIRDAWGRV